MYPYLAWFAGLTLSNSANCQMTSKGEIQDKLAIREIRASITTDRFINTV